MTQHHGRAATRIAWPIPAKIQPEKDKTMTRKISVMAGVFTLALSATSPIFAQEKTTMNADEMAVLAVVETMTKAFQAGDIAAVMESYEASPLVMFEPGVAVTDREQIIQMFTGFAAAKPVFTYRGHEVVLNGDTAVHIAPWTMVATGPEGVQISDSGLSVAVLRRQSDGGWKMIIDNPHGARLMAVQ
jgi:uncharacterized protein (TIGR02246 family)